MSPGTGCLIATLCVGAIDVLALSLTSNGILFVASNPLLALLLGYAVLLAENKWAAKACHARFAAMNPTGVYTIHARRLIGLADAGQSLIIVNVRNRSIETVRIHFLVAGSPLPGAGSVQSIESIGSELRINLDDIMRPLVAIPFASPAEAASWERRIQMALAQPTNP